MKASAQRKMMLPFRINKADVVLMDSRVAAAFDDGDDGTTIVSSFCDMHCTVVVAGGDAGAAIVSLYLILFAVLCTHRG
jgi:hypothetical protein